MNSDFGRLSRFEMGVPSKKGRIPMVTAIHLQSLSSLEIKKEKNGTACLSTKTSEDALKFEASIEAGERGSLILPASTVPHSSAELSRFMAMLGLECLAHGCLNLDDANREIVDHTGLNELRWYARYGKKGFIWPVHIRKLYESSSTFTDKEVGEYEVLHEWNILIVPAPGGTPLEGQVLAECYLVVAIFGVEFVINLCGPELDGYKKWLSDNNYKSYLYM